MSQLQGRGTPETFAYLTLVLRVSVLCSPVTSHLYRAGLLTKLALSTEGFCRLSSFPGGLIRAGETVISGVLSQPTRSHFSLVRSHTGCTFAPGRLPEPGPLRVMTCRGRSGSARSGQASRTREGLCPHTEGLERAVCAATGSWV